MLPRSRKVSEGWKFWQIPDPNKNTGTNKKPSSVWLDFPNPDCRKWSLRDAQAQLARTGRDQRCYPGPGAQISLVAAERRSIFFFFCIQSPVDDGQVSPGSLASHEHERVLFLEQHIFCFGSFVHEWYDQGRRGRCAQRLLDLWNVYQVYEHKVVMTGLQGIVQLSPLCDRLQPVPSSYQS